MKLTFFSSVLGYHQEGLCKAFYDILGENFHFVAYGQLPDFRKAAGFVDLADVYPFVVKAYTPEGRIKADELINNCDVAIIGAVDNSVIKKCVEAGKETYLFSERFFKLGIWRAFVPPIRKKVISRAAGYHQDNFKVLCASAYLPYDLSLCGWKGKAYRWGYFPDVKEYDADKLISLKSKDGEPVRLLWAARFLKLKHPEKAIELAKYLKSKNYNFKLDIIGYGELEERIINEIQQKKLDDVVCFLGKKNANEVHEAMEKADIFIMTSDYHEGWGVVINESLNRGCAVIADAAAGATRYLIENGKNGFVYKNQNLKSAYPVIEKLITDREFRATVQKNAYKHMIENYTPKIAAERLIKLCESGEAYESGVCSVAPIIKNAKEK